MVSRGSDGLISPISLHRLAISGHLWAYRWTSGSDSTVSGGWMCDSRGESTGGCSGKSVTRAGFSSTTIGTWKTSTWQMRPVGCRPLHTRGTVGSTRLRCLSCLPVIDFRLRHAIPGVSNVVYPQFCDWWWVKGTSIFRCSVSEKRLDDV